MQAYTSDAYVYALKQFISEKQPKLVLFPHTYQVRDFAPRLALGLDRTLISDSIGYKHEAGKLLFIRQMFQGKFAADVSFAGDAPWLATIQIGAFRGDQAQAGSAAVENVSAAVADTPARVTPHEVFQEAKQAVDLSQAEVIVAVGRGIKEQKNLALAEELAKVLGGEVAASRPICDNGWLPLERQIGSSGQTVAPKLYFALGISGAIQHIVGMKGSRTIVAINKDSEAPIFEIADVGVVGKSLRRGSCGDGGDQEGEGGSLGSRFFPFWAAPTPHLPTYPSPLHFCNSYIPLMMLMAWSADH